MELGKGYNFLSYFNFSVLRITYTNTEFYTKWLENYRREFAESIRKQKQRHREILEKMKKRKLEELYKKFSGKKFFGIGLYCGGGGTLKKIKLTNHNRNNFNFGVQTSYLFKPPYYGFNIGLNLDMGYYNEFFPEKNTKYVYQAFNITALANLIFATSYTRETYFLLQFGYSQKVKIEGEFGEKTHSWLLQDYYIF